MPISKTTPRSAARDGSAGTVTRARISENPACWRLSTRSDRLRSNESAITPPTGENTSSGPSCAAITKPTNTPERVRSYARAPRTTFCIQVPMFDAKAPR
jgi:hypothetical protein